MKRFLASFFLLLAVTAHADDKVAQALKQALSVGAQNAAGALARPDAYYKSAFRIPFPQEAKTMADTLNRIGMGSLVEQIVLSMNRAAESAAEQAKPVFLDAIRSMSIADALQILRGRSTAATDYLQDHTRTKLTAAYRPAVAAALDKVNATRYWSQAVEAYDRVPFVPRVNPDLAGYVTTRALDGLFVKVGEEEKRIRENPTARVTSLLKNVFGSARR